jgi:hypothetical protein
VHVPTFPALLHELHSPVHALSQHTPSAQWLVRHAASFVPHAWPRSSLQLPLPSHDCVEPAHAPSGLLSSWLAAMFVHVPGVAPAHVWHVGHDGSAQQTPSTQFPLVHWPPFTQLIPLGLFATHWLLALQK